MYFEHQQMHNKWIVRVNSIDSPMAECHIRPVWLSPKITAVIQKLESEFDPEKGYNVMPLYWLKSLFQKLSLHPVTEKALHKITTCLSLIIIFADSGKTVYMLLVQFMKIK